jgi:hypothetical protein
MNHDKTFEAIEKLKEVEIELHRLKNALERMNNAYDTAVLAERDRIADETKYEKWVGLTLEEIDAAIAGNITITDPNLRDGVYGAIVDIELLLKEKNTHET